MLNLPPVPQGVSILSSTGSQRDPNAEYAECPVCCDDLYKEPLSVLTARGKRVCRHFFHSRCSVALLESDDSMMCPICRSEYDALRSVPLLQEDADGWFSVVDCNGDGKLSPTELLDVMKASCCIDWKRLERELPSLWPRWDKNNDGTIDKNELLHPDRGLIKYIIKHLPRPPSSSSSSPSPDLRADPLGWFNYFDADLNGTLDQQEIVRAIIKCFKMHKDAAAIQAVRSVVAALWTEFDPDMDGHVTSVEFSREGGLAETINANLQLK